MLLHRYGSVDFVFGLDIVDGCALINKAVEEERREKYHRQYCAILPVMLKADKYTPFEEFYDSMTGKNLDMRPAEEIIAEAQKIEREMLKKEGEQAGTRNI